MTWGAHSSMPGAFPPEPSSQPRSNSGRAPSTSREECIELPLPRRSRTFRRWARQTFFHRSSPEFNAGWSDDSGYDSWSLSSSSGSEKALFEHPTYGKPGLSICDTDDYLTVQNPNPHTGEMSPSVLSLVSERTEPPPSTHDPPEALNITLNGKQSLQKEHTLRWRLLGKELPPTPRKADVPPPRPPKVTVEDEEPPDALDSTTQPLQSQPPPDHYAAFDPDHLRMPGALTITPPIKTVTNGGTDAISTWVAEESRKVFELPAGPLTPGDRPPASSSVGPAGPRLIRSHTKSRTQVPTVARTRSYSAYDAREAFCAQSRERVLGPRHPWERPANTTTPRRVCSIPRKPLAGQYVALPPRLPHGPDDIVRPMPQAMSPMDADHAAPPPPPHRYEAGRPYHRGEWNTPFRPPLDTPSHSSLSVLDAPLTAPNPMISVPNPQLPESGADTHHRATQTRASVAGTFKRHPIQPSFETPSVRAQTRLNGTGVQRLVITTGKPRQAGLNGAQTATAGTQTALPTGAANTRAQAADSPPEGMKKSTPTATASSPAKQPKPTSSTSAGAGGSKSTRKKLTKSTPTSKASVAASATREKGATKTTSSATASKPPTARVAPAAAPTAAAKPAANTTGKTATADTSSGAAVKAAAAKDAASFAAQRAAALAALREQHSRHCSTGKHATAATAAAAVDAVEKPSEGRAELAGGLGGGGGDDAPLIAVRVSKRAAVTAAQVLAFVWAVTAGWYMLGVVGRGLMVVLWPIWWVLKGIAVVGGCVRGGGWGGG